MLFSWAEEILNNRLKPAEYIKKISICFNDADVRKHNGHGFVVWIHASKGRMQFVSARLPEGATKIVLDYGDIYDSVTGMNLIENQSYTFFP